jgi:hypothetical protein
LNSNTNSQVFGRNFSQNEVEDNPFFLVNFFSKNEIQNSNDIEVFISQKQERKKNSESAMFLYLVFSV